MSRALGGNGRLKSVLLLDAALIALSLSLISLPDQSTSAPSLPARQSEDPSQTATSSCTPSATDGSATSTPSEPEATATSTPDGTTTPTMQVSASSTATQETATVSPSASTSLTPTTTPIMSFPPFSVLVNEVAWAGTRASAFDEWIELYNPGVAEIDLTGWLLEDGGDISVALSGTIAPHSMFLLERTDDTTIADIAADLIYKGGLNNGGEPLWLRDPSGAIIDSANAAGGNWPAGDSASRASMERIGGNDSPGNWATWNGNIFSGHDAGGNPVAGTPKQHNSMFYPTPTPTSIPGRVVINEVLIRPHYDWNRSGEADVGDEFIELYNHGPAPVVLSGWILDDVAAGGARPYTIPHGTILPGNRIAFFRSQTHVSLNDSGDIVRLLAPDGRLVDQIRFIRVRAYNLSYGRLPDGSSNLVYSLWPTPGAANVLFVEPQAQASTTPADEASPSSRWDICPRGSQPWPLLASCSRHPAMMRWMLSIGFFVCR